MFCIVLFGNYSVRNDVELCIFFANNEERDNIHNADTMWNSVIDIFPKCLGKLF